MDSVAAAVKSKIDVLLGEKDFAIVAIDGKCTSGKTTLASKLLSAVLFNMRSGKQRRSVKQHNKNARIRLDPRINFRE